MVRGPVHEDHDLLPPIAAELLREDLGQPRQEQLHDVLVGVDLREGEPHKAFR